MRPGHDDSIQEIIAQEDAKFLEACNRPTGQDLQDIDAGLRQASQIAADSLGLTLEEYHGKLGTEEPPIYLHEHELLEHYNNRLEYYSPADTQDLFALMQLGGAPMKGSMLDVGCGDGRAYKYAKAWEMSYLGIDYSSQRIAKAWEGMTPDDLDFSRGHTPVFVCADLYRALPTLQLRYDLIFCCELLEHLEEPQKVWEEMKRLCDPEGVVICTCPVDMPYKAHLQVWKTDDELRAALPGITEVHRIRCKVPGGSTREHFLFTYVPSDKKVTLADAACHVAVDDPLRPCHISP